MDNILIILPDFNIKNLDGILKNIVENVSGKYGIEVVVPVEKTDEDIGEVVHEQQISEVNVKILSWNLVSSGFFPGASGSVPSRYIFFLGDESALGERPFDIAESVRQMEKGKDIIIGVPETGIVGQRPVKRIMEKIEKILLFPDIRYPFCRTFGCTYEVYQTGSDYFYTMPSLPELLVKTKWNTIGEVRYTPGENNQTGSCSCSGAGIKQVWDFIVFGLKHRDSHIRHELGNVFRFGLVGFSGIFVNCGLLYLLTEYIGIFYLLSSVVAIEASIISNFLLNDFWTFKNRETRKVSAKIGRFFSFQCVAVGGMLINISVLFFLTDFFGIYYIISNIIGILVTFSWNFIVNRNVTWKSIG